MNILISFMPFFAFAILIHLGFVEPVLWTGAIVTGGLGILLTVGALYVAFRFTNAHSKGRPVTS
jgi:hypothetical protein